MFLLISVFVIKQVNAARLTRMFRFSCFHSPVHFLKPKKTVQLPTEAMQKTLEDHNTNKPKPNKDPVFTKGVPNADNANPFPSSAGQDRKPEALKSTNDNDSEQGHKTRAIRKCVSVGTGLAAYQDVTSGEDSYSSHGDRSGDEFHNARASVSPQISSNLVNNASDMSPDRLSSRSRSHTTCTPNAFVKSNSLPHMHLTNTDAVDKPVDSDSVDHADKSDGDGDGDEAYDYAGSAKDWIVPGDEPGKGKTIHEEYLVTQWNEMPTEDFKIRRVEKWVMDLQHSSSLDETDTLTDLDHQGQNGKSTNNILDPIPASKTDAKSVLGMDAAKRYISSLNPAATTAQLANHGLVVVPFLSGFLSLRALNLSGNSIVKITVGALPRGLHILNLSKNSISTIEGLRDLTRLRVLDLSYNRILRIGHGLALCSSLKELYLAGNKISEVEGLHRLLKLSVLDLRFNKLSTTKSLGQLAANYSSLQAISLEGNPAQKNIGDEPLKKYVLGLLPNITYFNRKSIKSGAVKDSTDRAARHGIRSESKKSTHGRRSQGVSARGRHVRLPPSGVKAVGDRHQFPDVSSQLVSSRPDSAMRRAHSEGMLRGI